MDRALSIITSVLNGRPFLEQMLASVPLEASIEHIVVDAGSSDGTLDLLEQRPALRLFVRPGLPLYEAWNEALAVAKGRFVLFLNADDLLVSSGLAIVLKSLTQHSADVFLCESEAFLESGGSPRVAFSYRGNAVAGLALDSLVFGPPTVNSKVFRRALLLDVGGFDTSFRFAADRDLILRLVRMNLNVQFVQKLLYRYRIHPGSMTLKQTSHRRVEIAREHRRIAIDGYGSFSQNERACRMMRQWYFHETAVLLGHGLVARDFSGVREAAGELLRSGIKGLHALACARNARRAYRSRLYAAQTKAEGL